MVTAAADHFGGAVENGDEVGGEGGVAAVLENEESWGAVGLCGGGAWLWAGVLVVKLAEALGAC